MELSVLSSPFCYEPQAALKINLLRMYIMIITSERI